MINSNLIHNKQNTLHLDQNIGIIEFDFLSHIAIVEAGLYLGSLSFQDLKNFDKDKKVSDFRFSFIQNVVNKNANWIEIMTVFSKNKSNVVAVIDDFGQYIGDFLYQDTIKLLDEDAFFKENGNVFQIAVSSEQFDLNQIIQIASQNNMPVLGLFLSNISSNEIVITIKTNQIIQNQIFQDFIRFGYSIISNHKKDLFLTNLEENAKYFETYLNV